MIVFDLECSQRHRFEGWFESLESFEEQKRKRFVSCPYCNDVNIKRVFSPVALKKSDPPDLKQSHQGLIDYQRLAKEIVDYVHKNFEDVGPNFAKEALKIHYEVADKRNIRGSATDEEEKLLKEEGIDFFKIPLPKTDEEEKKN
jgi:hypothetical protein